jgi:hypothetical protein
VRLEPLYRLRFGYPEEYEVHIDGPRGQESQYWFLGKGRVEGRISGRFHGMNYPRRRTDNTFLPDMRSVIETDDGAVIFQDCRGYGRAHPPGRRQVVVALAHLAGDERYRWLNDVVCVGSGEVRAVLLPSGAPSGEAELVIDVAELIWEPIDLPGQQ